jgi:hypothetical protein
VPEWRVQTSLAKAGSNLVVGLNAPQTPNQNCADDNNIQIISFVSLAPVPELREPCVGDAP